MDDRAKKELAAEVASHRHGRVPQELRRRQVLAEAHDLFVERGYAGASMEELARRVGVTKPVIYGVAGSKEELFREVMASIDRELTAHIAMAVAGEADDRRRLRAGILAFLEFVRERRDAWGALLTAAAGPPAAELAALRRRQAELVAGLVGAGLEARDPRTAEVIAQAINGAVEFVAMWWQDHPDIPAEALADLLTTAFSSDVLRLAAKPLV